MKYKRYIILFICVFVMGCNKNTVDEAFYKAIPGEDQELLHTQQVQENMIGLYKAPLNDHTGIGIVIFQKNKSKGWKVIDYSSFYIPSKFTVDAKKLELGQEETYRILYGYLDDPNIAKIEVTDKHGEIMEASIISTDWKRIWYAVAEINEIKVKAYSEDGHVLADIPYSP